MSKRGQQGDEAVEVPLVRPYGRTLLGTVGIGASGVFMAYRAQENARGLIINGIIHLDPGQADVFYAVCAVFCLGVSVLLAMSLYALRPSLPFRLVVAAGEVRLPLSPLWKPGEAVVPLDDVTGVELGAHARQQILVIVTRTSGRFALPIHYLPSDWSVTRVSELIVAAARSRRAPVTGAL